MAPGGPVERRDHVVREAEDLGRLADRRARAIGGDRGGEPGALAPVALIDVLDHLLAPLVLEIDVDVGRLVALGRDEALEQEIEARRIDLGDAEAEADRGIGRRAAALAQDSATSGEAHDVVHGEKIRRVVERGDQRHFVLQRLARPFGHALRITRPRAGFGKSFERGLGRGKAFAQLLRIAMGEFVQAEREAVEEADRLLDGFRRFGEEPRHLARTFKMALGVGLGQAPRDLERASLANAGDDVGERAPLGRMHQRIVGRDEPAACLTRQRGASRETATHVLAVSQACADPEARTEGVAEAEEDFLLPLREKVARRAG